MHNPALIKAASIITLIVFILIMVISVFVLVTGLWMTGPASDLFESTTGGFSNDDPGAGWLVPGGVLISFFGSFIGFFMVVTGIAGIIADLVIYAPAFIAKRLYKKNGNVQTYWILMGIWLLLILITAAMLLMLA